MEDTSHRGGGGGEERGAKEGRDGEVPGLGKAGGSPGNPDVRGAAAAARGEWCAGAKSGSELVPPGSGGPGREQEARLLKLGGDGGELGDSGADDVADGIVTEDPVTSTPTTQGVVTPAIENFTAEPAGGVTVPDRHAKTTLHGHAEERRRNVRVAGGRGGREPGACAGGTAGIKVKATGPCESWREAWRRCGPQFCPRGTSERRRRIRHRYWCQRGATSVAVRRHPSSMSKATKIGPDGGAEIAASGEAANVSSGSVLTGGPGTDPTRGDAKGREAPIVISERSADEAPEGKTDVGVSGKEACWLRIWRNSAAGVEDFGPPRTRPEEAEGTLSVGEATDGIDESPGLGDAAAKKKFTPIRWPNGRPEQFERSGPIPVASW